MKKLILAISVLGFIFNTYSQQTGTFADPRDGKVYKTVKIGNEIWFAENLAYKPGSGNYWAYDNDQSNLAIYGYLYDWETAKNVCPIGWHLPNKDEVKALTQSVAILGGCYLNNVFYRIGIDAYVWSSSPDNAKCAWSFAVNKTGQVLASCSLQFLDNDGHIMASNNLTCGFSVRCIKDN